MNRAKRESHGRNSKQQLKEQPQISKALLIALLILPVSAFSLQTFFSAIYWFDILGGLSFSAMVLVSLAMVFSQRFASRKPDGQPSKEYVAKAIAVVGALFALLGPIVFIVSLFM